jgi:glycosyltransferase involved in cell wall biosynthesis
VWNEGSRAWAAAPIPVAESTLGRTVRLQPAGRNEGTIAVTASATASAPQAAGIVNARCMIEDIFSEDGRTGPVPGPEVTVVMPVFNEQATVERAIASVFEARVAEDFELIVVDDGSVDGTVDILREGSWPDGVRILYHERNRGKGAALRTALEEARGLYTTVMDADLEYDPTDIPALLEHLRNGDAVAVFGTRGFQSQSAYSFWYVIGNRSVTFAANLIYNSWISDMMTGQKAIRTELFRSLKLRERGFAIEAEITARLLRKGIRIYEVPIVYRARSREEGKKLTPVDGLRVLRTLARCRIL